MKGEKVFITGSSGLIGSHLVDLLLDNGYIVIGLSKNFPLKKNQLAQFSNENYTPIEGDVRNRELLCKILEKHDPHYIIHLAAQAIVGDALKSADETFDINIKGTWNLLQECLKLKNLNRIIIASSDKAYGEHEELPYQEDFELKAVHPYDLSKKITEQLAHSYFITYNLPVLITRCGNTFGPYDLNMSRIVPSTILSCLNNEKIVLRSNGKQERSYIYVKDVVRAYLLMLETDIKTVKGEAFNIGTDESFSVLRLVEKICNLTHTQISNIEIKDNAVFEISNQSLNSSKAKKMLGWEPTYLIDDALNETISWYYSENNHSPL